MTATNALIEFHDTSALRQRLVVFIEEHAQLPPVDGAMFETQEMIGLALRKRREKADQIVRHLLLLLARNERPILDLDLQHTLDQFLETIATHKPENDHKEALLP